jgi:hypothetical protein
MSAQQALDFTRDRVLGYLAARRAVLIHAADRIALELAARDGSVCMPRILRALREHGYGDDLDDVDPRWTGAVLLPSRGWERTGEIVREGSRARPVPMWRRAR